MPQHTRPRVAVPQPTSTDPEYNQRCWSQYATAIESSGGLPVEILLDQDPAAIARQVSSCTAILLPGSPADVHPQKYGEATDPRTAPRDVLREAADELLLQDAFNLHKPLLGICYGHQSMNVWKGGSLVQHLETSVDHTPGRTVDDAHPVAFTPAAHHLQAAFAAPTGFVNSSHHQAVSVPGDGLLLAASAAADGVVEAVEAAEGFVVGVQWHPERTFATHAPSRRLFADFIAAARSWQAPVIETPREGSERA